MENKLFLGSICLSELNEKAKAGHPAFSKANNGKIYVNVNLWHNDEPDQYEKVAQLQLAKPKDSKEATIYVGSFSLPKKKEPEAIVETDIPDDDDFPF
jgi:hypothetical protein